MLKEKISSGSQPAARNALWTSSTKSKGGTPVLGTTTAKNNDAHVYCGMVTYEFEVVGLGASGNQDVDLTKLGVQNT